MVSNQLHVLRRSCIWTTSAPRPPISSDPAAQGGGAAATAIIIVTLQDIRSVIASMQRFVQVHPVDLEDAEQVQELVAHSWPEPPYSQLDTDASDSSLESPRRRAS
ncbi:MAG: hypothetical protein AB1Z98_12500 [Nannocystaceae bacterium]